MSEFLKSALTNISSNWANNANYIDQENEFIGQTIELKGHRLKVEKVLAKGGYGFVFKVRDARNQENYALKRLIASCKESKADIMNEIKILTKLQAHPHIMKFISWGQMENNMVYLVLCELCGNGSLSDLKLPLDTTQQLNKILYQTANAISHLHRLNIIHRDIKAENILFDNNGFVKLCDFGSATMESYHPNPDWTALQRSIVEDEMKRKTTPIYRPPEILDTYLNYKINKSMDIWALGCMIFLLKFKEHPFKDYSVLQIVNCCYNFPAGSAEDVHTELIKSCLKINPDTRITIEGIIEVLENNFVDLIAPCVSPKLISPSTNNIFKNMYNSSNFIPNNVNLPGTAQSSFGLSGFTKYLKDTSNKVMQTVQQSITKQDLDLSYLTSNLIVMSYPAEGLESTYRNHYEDVKAYLDSRNCPYMIINVSGRTYGSYKFGHNTKLINGDDSWKDTNKISSFVELIEISDKISDWLNEQKNKKLVVIHCLDGKINSSIMVNAFLLYVGMFKNYEASSNFFAVKRCPINMNAAHKRYLEYVTNFKLKNKVELFDQKSEKVIVKSIIMNGIPLFSKNRDGCRPVLEIFTEKDKKIFSSLKEFEDLIVYNKVCDFRIHWKDLNIECNSKNDLYIVIHHARPGLGSRMLQSKMINFIKICCVQFNLTMERKVETGTQILKFDLINLDSIDEVEKYPKEFKLAIEIEYTKQTNDNEKLSNKLTEATFDIINLFESYEELEDCKDTFSCKRPKIEETNKTDFKSSKSSPNLFTRNDISKENSEIFDSLKTPSTNNLDQKPCCSNTYTKEKNNSISNDLLNLGLNETKNFSDKNIPCDLLGNFDDTNQQANIKNLDLLNDLLPDEKSNQKSTNTSNLDLLNELFLKDNLINEKNLGPDLLNEPNEFKSKESFNNVFKNNQQKIIDPFDDFFEKSNTNKFSNHKTEPLKPIPSKKVSNDSNLKNDFNSKNYSNITNSFSTNGIKQKPDYNRSYFNEPKPTSSKISEDAFGDLLGGFSVQNDKNKTNKSMAELKKAEMLRDGTIDPLRLKVNDWKENKTRNIRALLGSLHTIVWPDCNWTQVGMNQLINKPDVKKMYRKACLAVHPDKLMGTEHEELAKLIFVELNDAWNEFEKQTQF